MSRFSPARRVAARIPVPGSRCTSYAATHLGGQGTDAAVIMAKIHHRSIRTVARCTWPGLAAITQATALLDPPRRRG